MLSYHDEIAAQTAGRLDDGLGAGVGNLNWLLEWHRTRGFPMRHHITETLCQESCLIVGEAQFPGCSAPVGPPRSCCIEQCDTAPAILRQDSGVLQHRYYRIR